MDTVEMRGLTLTQPWATLVAIGAKQFETRSWAISYKGDIAIHAAKGFPKDAKSLCNLQPFRGVLMDFLQPMHSGIDLFHHPALWTFLPVGKIICVVSLKRIIRTEQARRHEDMTNPFEMNFGDYGDGRYAWDLRNVRLLKETVEARGALSLWKIDAELRAKIEAQYLAPLQGPINRDPDWRAHPVDLLKDS